MLLSFYASRPRVLSVLTIKCITAEKRRLNPGKLPGALSEA